MSSGHAGYRSNDAKHTEVSVSCHWKDDCIDMDPLPLRCLEAEQQAAATGNVMEHCKNYEKNN